MKTTGRIAFAVIGVVGCTWSLHAQGQTPPSHPIPADARPGPTLQAPEVSVKFNGSKPGLTFYTRGDYFSASTTDTTTKGVSQQYKRICTAPCDAKLPAGTYMMALSHGHDSPSDVDDPVRIEGPSSIEGSHSSNTAVRVVGYVVPIATTGVGVYLVISGVLRTKEDCATVNNATVCEDKQDVDWTKVGVGFGVIVVGAIVGSILRGVQDSATINVIPAGPTAVSSYRLSGGYEPAGDRLRTPIYTPGLTLNYSF